MKTASFRLVPFALMFGLVTSPLVASQTANGAARSKIPAPASNVETLQLASKTFNNTRSIRVLLPPGYHNPENSKKRYPVFYFNDGIMVFRPNRINVEEVVYKLIGRGELPPIIVVGIDNGGSTNETKNPETDRANEFLPYPDVGFAPDHLYAPDPPSPQGKLYPQFLIDEVMPLVKQRYRVGAGPSNTGLGGFSRGGVAALYTVMSRPGVFGKLLLESTPLWIGPDRQLLKDAREARKWPLTVYIGVGTKEAPDEAINNEGRQGVETLRAIIREKSPRTSLKVVVEEGGKHEPSAWRGRLPSALQFLFDMKAGR